MGNLPQRLPHKEESEDSAPWAAVSLPAVSGADERGTVASARGAGVVDAAGDGPAQVTGKGRPC